MSQTNTQKMAQTAYRRIHERGHDPEFAGFARSFPSLIHACGLAQAIAFAKAKKRESYLDDLACVLRGIGHAEAGSSAGLEKASREFSVTAYVRLSRNALLAAGWLKRYAEAADEE